MTTQAFADFPDLLPFAGWALPTVEQRVAKRLNSSYEDIKRFHDAVVPRLEEIIVLLNRFPFDGVPHQLKPLGYIALAALAVENPVNKWQSAHLEDACDPRRFSIKGNFYDTTIPQDNK